MNKALLTFLSVYIALDKKGSHVHLNLFIQTVHCKISVPDIRQLV